MPAGSNTYKSKIMDRLTGINTYVIAFLLIFLSSVPAYSFCFKEAGEMYDIAPEILEAIAQVESNYRHDAVNFGNFHSCACKIQIALMSSMVGGLVSAPRPEASSYDVGAGGR